METPNPLYQEFPGHSAAIARLDSGDAGFQALFHEYLGMDREIKRLETGVEFAESDIYTEALLKERLRIRELLYLKILDAEDRRGK
ncbi:MAG: GTP-binding protein [candidate division FCPU426 bacterium]